MLTVIHLEPNEFADILFKKQTKVDVRMYVLENSIAGIVYTTKDDEHFYYLDRFYPSIDKKKCIDNMDCYELHKELYRLVNLDGRNHAHSLLES